MTKKTAVKQTSAALAATKPAAAKTAPAAAVPDAPSPAKLQLKAYEEAVALFSQRRLPEAHKRFLDAAGGPDAHVADKSRSYAQVCERRTRNAELDLKTAEDHFNYGVERLNERDFDRAMRHFAQALELQPDAEHVYYTRALCCGLAGDGEGACENLKRAIDLEPRNRILARQDPEFTAVLPQLPGLRTLIYDLPARG